MSLLTQAMEDVVLMEKKRQPDGDGSRWQNVFKDRLRKWRKL